MRYLLLFVIGFFLIGCSTDDDTSQIQEVEICVTILDATNDQPISNASLKVQWVVSGIYSGSIFRTYRSDGYGKACFSKETNEAYSHEVRASGYITRWSYGLPTTIKLFPIPEE
ncbi:MAG: hypothetical protein HKN68_15650 [Saprospiraceae bacterium]|nr:hypothetical protein [Saprospiraceae bacterium]